MCTPYIPYKHLAWRHCTDFLVAEIGESLSDSQIAELSYGKQYMIQVWKKPCLRTHIHRPTSVLNPARFLRARIDFPLCTFYVGLFTERRRPVFLPIPSRELCFRYTETYRHCCCAAVGMCRYASVCVGMCRYASIRVTVL
jgi:hypothetical protein